MTGRIETINIDRHEVRIQLDNDPKDGPKDNVFILRDDHANRTAIFSLALAAAANRWPVTIRVAGDAEQIDTSTEASIHLFGVVWAGDPARS
jgi:hypothetical protein